jgi:3-oxoacyl-ACP reductase-like protein
MKKNLIKSALVLSIAALFTACGGNNNENQAPAGNATPANNAAPTQPADNAGTEAAAPAASGANYDQIINDYSSMIDQMIEMNKKIEAGDMSAMNNYQSLMQKSAKLSQDIQNVQGQLTPEQLSKYEQLMTKIEGMN